MSIHIEGVAFLPAQSTYKNNEKSQDALSSLLQHLKKFFKSILGRDCSDKSGRTIHHITTFSKTSSDAAVTKIFVSSTKRHDYYK